MFKNLVSDSRGQDLVEYALMTLFVAAAAIAIVPSTAETLQTGFNPLTIRVVCGVLAVVLVGLIFWRGSKKADEKW